MPQLYHPTARSCSHDGRTYARDATGAFEVPEHAVEALAAHGFTRERVRIVPTVAELQDLLTSEREAHALELEAARNEHHAALALERSTGALVRADLEARIRELEDVPSRKGKR